MRRYFDRTVVAALVALSSVATVGPAFAQRTREDVPVERNAAARQRNRVTIPADTVVRAKLDTELSSRDAARGDRVIATISADDRSEFPEGTQFEGEVIEVQPATKEEPGVIDVEFTRMLLPSGPAVPIRGQLASLGDEDVRRTADGRLEVRRRTNRNGGKFETKWVGYGAGAGAVLATVLGGGFLKGALLGGLGGAVYGYLNKNKNNGREERFVDVNLAEGTEFGIRFENEVAYNPNRRYRYLSDRFEEDREQVAGSREVRDNFNFSTADVRVNGRALTFEGSQPMNLNGVMYVPLRAVADATNMRLTHYAGEETFILVTPAGRVRAATTEPAFVDANNARVELLNDPMLINGEVYVSTEFLSRAAGLEVNWDRASRRLEINGDRIDTRVR